MNDILERDIEAYLVKQVEAHGGEVRKVKWIGRNGAPDRFVMLPGMQIWVELKAPGVKVKPHQIREHERMEKAGAVIKIIDSFDKVDALFL